MDAGLVHARTLLQDLPRRPPLHRHLYAVPQDPEPPTRRLTPEQAELVAAHAEGARRIAVAMTSRDRDEAISAARLALTEAALVFDPSRGVPFMAYAAHHIRGAVRSLFRGPVLAPLDDRPLVDDGPGPEDLTCRTVDSARLHAALASLDLRDRLVVVGLHLERIRQDDLARLLGVSRPMVSRMNTRALARLRDLLTEEAA